MLKQHALEESDMLSISTCSHLPSQMWRHWYANKPTLFIFPSAFHSLSVPYLFLHFFLTLSLTPLLSYWTNSQLNEGQIMFKCSRKHFQTVILLRKPSPMHALMQSHLSAVLSRASHICLYFTMNILSVFFLYSTKSMSSWEWHLKLKIPSNVTLSG